MVGDASSRNVRPYPRRRSWLSARHSKLPFLFRFPRIRRKSGYFEGRVCGSGSLPARRACRSFRSRGIRSSSVCGGCRAHLSGPVASFLPVPLQRS